MRTIRTLNQIDGTKLHHPRAVWQRPLRRLPTSFLTRRQYARPTEARQLEVVLHRRAVRATQASKNTAGGMVYHLHDAPALEVRVIL